MRILLLDVNCKYSSTGKIVYDLYTELNRSGHVAAIGYGRGKIVKEENIYRFSPKWEVYLHALLTRLTGYNGYFSPIATRRLIKFIETFRPDVVHLHDMHGYFVNLIPLINYLKQKQIRTIWTFHCEYMYTGKCGHAYDCEKWKDECGKCPQVKAYPASLLFDKTKSMFLNKKKAFRDWKNLVIVTPSEWLANRVRDSFLKKSDIRVIQNGIDIKIFRPQSFELLKNKYHLTNEKIVLAAAANLMSEIKGGAMVIEIARRMKNQNIKFILLGVNEKQNSFQDNIIAIPTVLDQKELAMYYSMADVFLICSKRENFPTTCIEALCCGTPVVGFDTGGTSETAKCDMGKFFQYGDIDGMVSGIEEFLIQDRNRLSYDCEQYGVRYYAKENMYRQYLALYNEDRNI